jgi:uncharacterized protein
MAEKIFYSYNTIHSLVKSGSKDVLNSDFNPEIILAIGGGGFIPARILRTYINLPIVSTTINFYDQNDKIQSEPNIIQMIDKDIIKNKNVLIVDEVDDTRKTLDFFINFLKNNYYQFKSLGVFVVNNKIKNKVSPIPDDVHYFSCTYSPDIWINYPWDII